MTPEDALEALHQLRVTVQAREAEAAERSRWRQASTWDIEWWIGKRAAYRDVLSLLPVEPEAWTTDTDGQPF